MKILSWNVRGLNSPQKRKRVFHYLEKCNVDIVCLQESHIKTKDVRLIKNKKIGKEYVNSIEKSKRGVIIYVKHHLESREIFRDKNGYYLGVEICWSGKKILIVGSYSPQDNKKVFLVNYKKRLVNLIMNR